MQTLQNRIFGDDYKSYFVSLLETNGQMECRQKNSERKAEKLGSCLARLDSRTLGGSHPMAGVEVCSAVAPLQVHVHRSGIPVVIHLVSSGEVSLEMIRFTRVISSRKSVNEQAGDEKL